MVEKIFNKSGTNIQYSSHLKDNCCAYASTRNSNENYKIIPLSLLISRIYVNRLNTFTAWPGLLLGWCYSKVYKPCFSTGLTRAQNKESITQAYTYIKTEISGLHMGLKLNAS